MRWFLFGEDKIVAKWVQERLGVEFNDYSAIGIMEGDTMIAGVVYHGYLPEYGNIEMSIAADTPRWATKAALKVFLSYPFKQLKCRRVTACCKANNKRVIRFNHGIGFRKEGCIRQGFGGEDMIVMGMLKNEAHKWINTSN